MASGQVGLPVFLSDPENSRRKRAAADRAYRELLGELWNRRTALAAAKENRPLVDNLQHIPREVKIRNGKAGFPLLHYLLTAPHLDTGSLDVVQMLWRPEGFPPARAATLWRELDAYSERIRPIWIARNRDVYDLDWTMESLGIDFRQRFSSIADALMLPLARSTSAAPKQAPLMVTRFWHSRLAPELPRALPVYEREGFTILASEATADGLWLMGNAQGFKITLPGFHTDTFDAPRAPGDREWVRWIQSSPTALYASIADSRGVQPARELARYDFATRTWTTRELPLDFCNEFTLIGESVYLSGGGDRAGLEPPGNRSRQVRLELAEVDSPGQQSPPPRAQPTRRH